MECKEECLPFLSIIIVSYKTKEYLKECLLSIKKNVVNIPYEIIVVDNHSLDGTVDMIRNEFSEVTLIENTKNLGFAKANNQAFKLSKGEFILLLNPDTVVLPGSILRMVRFMEKEPSAGAVGCEFIKPEGTPLHLWRDGAFLPRYHFFPLTRSIFVNKIKRLFNISDVKSTEGLKEVDWVSGACMLLRKSVLDVVGFLDESYFMFMEEIDLCWRIKKSGFKVYLINDCKIIHHEGGSYKESEERDYAHIYRFQKSQYFFRKKFYGKMNALFHLFMDIWDNIMTILSFHLRYYLSGDSKRMEDKVFIQKRRKVLKVLQEILMDEVRDTLKM